MLLSYSRASVSLTNIGLHIYEQYNSCERNSDRIASSWYYIPSWMMKKYGGVNLVVGMP